MSSRKKHKHLVSVNYNKIADRIKKEQKGRAPKKKSKKIAV